MGFTFNGIHSDNYKIGVTAINHVAKPAKRVTQLTIPGRHGTYDITDNTYDNITIKIDCVYIGYDYRDAARNIAAWLSGAGELILDTEPGKRYMANAYAAIDTTETGVLTDFSISFCCKPYAISDIKEEKTTITDNKQTLVITSNGNVATPTKIYLKNTGDAPVTGIKITIKKRC